MKGQNIKQIMDHIPCEPQGQDVLLLQNDKPNEVNGLWRESRPENGSKVQTHEKNLDQKSGRVLR
jgi:hypothetical protein